MIRIAITQAEFEAFASTLPPSLGNLDSENKIDEEGRRLVWLEPKVINHLRALRRPGESYSDVILALAAADKRNA